MGFRGRFEFGLAWRALVLLAAFGLLVAAVTTPGLAAARIVAGLIALAALASLWTHIRRTNFEIARFVEALRYDDFSQRFASSSGGGFDVLGDALDGALKSLRDRRVGLAEETRFLSAAIDDAPVALLSIADDGAVEALNKAARRLFDRAPLTRVEDFAVYGAELAAAVALPPGARRMTRVVLDGIVQRVILATARVERLGGGLTIASILPVQAELGRVELATQADLVRVLTHEIMNSLTPVTSLARSVADLFARAAQRDPTLAEANEAIATLSSRADGILRFVESYRSFANAPQLRRRSFAASVWANDIGRLVAADPRANMVAFASCITPERLSISGDPDLLAQVMLNLVRNAALAGASRVELRVLATRHGGVRIDVADDGPGIPADRREDVFLPFYTTRRDGSGVGLSFARQVALAHGGSIMATDSDLGGAGIGIQL